VTHLTPEEFVDAAEETLPAERRAHLEACEACRGEVARLAALLREARELPVPEPSPMFWDHFSARVREAVAGQPQAPRGWSGWLRWPVLLPAGALALLVLALVSPLSRQGTSAIDPVAQLPVITATAASDVALAQDPWELVAELVGPMDWETAGAAGLGVVPGEVDSVLLQLDESERRELSRLIERELARSKS